MMLAETPPGLHPHPLFATVAELHHPPSFTLTDIDTDNHTFTNLHTPILPASPPHSDVSDAHAIASLKAAVCNTAAARFISSFHHPHRVPSPALARLGAYITLPALSVACCVSLPPSARPCFIKNRTLLPLPVRVRDSYCFARTAVLRSDVEMRRDENFGTPQTTAQLDSRLIHPMTLLTQQRKVDRSAFDADAFRFVSAP
jgi:hypothetical protein